LLGSVVKIVFQSTFHFKIYKIKNLFLISANKNDPKDTKKLI
jgi:hypothetical protein